jgi:glycine cleavage system H protein
MLVPTNLKFAKTDEWVKVEGKIATIGVSDYAQDQLSDVVFVEIIVSPGEQVKKGMVFCTIESVKAAADVNLPVSGKVIGVNEALPNTPELVNSSPFDKAWMLKVEMSSTSDLDSLMDAAAYEKFCQERSH